MRQTIKWITESSLSNQKKPRRLQWLQNNHNNQTIEWTTASSTLLLNVSYILKTSILINENDNFR